MRTDVVPANALHADARRAWSTVLIVLALLLGCTTAQNPPRFGKVIDEDGQPLRLALDPSRRLVSARSTHGGNSTLDIVDVTYDALNRIESVTFASGYRVTYAYSTGGAHIVRDAQGASAVFSAHGGQSILSSMQDPTGRLAPALERLELVLAALSPRAAASQ